MFNYIPSNDDYQDLVQRSNRLAFQNGVLKTKVWAYGACTVLTAYLAFASVWKMKIELNKAKKELEEIKSNGEYVVFNTEYKEKE